ncbi:Cytochrome P450,Cytochrome P450, E-class, group IV,Cytochrome P450, conserved site [Cinara cedri]|uniref:Cytochrome P450,Cytochrome P450, E-class, group IV,Cytochrome P450, conserved site n=1 Tax=Cinara cedri TaxID=506608 RepID=A0A5E4MAI6_9HEMI|nr:Cytochrome P450,Cytochrome P450, E-class, group IV,Cytochrome P450, conserved site [Cinara cedri]
MFAHTNILNNVTSYALPTTKSELYIYASVVISVILWCRMRWQYRQFYRLAHKIKGPPSYPLKGSIFDMSTTPEKILYKFKESAVKNEYEPVKLWVGPFLFVGVYKPEDVQIVLNSSSALEKGLIYHIIRHAVGEGVFTAPMSKWKKHRRIIATIFSSKFLDQLYPIFNKNNKKLVELLSKHTNDTQPFDVWDYIISCNLNNVSQAAMGYDRIDKRTLAEFVLAMKKVSELSNCIVKPWLYLDQIFAVYAYITGLKVYLDQLNRVSLQIIRDKKLEFKTTMAAQQSNKSANGDVTEKTNKSSIKVFLDKLLKLNNEGADFTDGELKDEVITMTVAGSDTSAISECFCVLLLAMHQDIQDKVYDEIYNVLGDSDRDVTPDDLFRFKYLEMVLKETLRLFPPGAIFSRKTDANIRLTNCELPKGCNVFVSPYVTHRCPELYPDPDSFNPENFSPENESERHKFSFLAFSGGPRGCLGVKYAMISMKLMMIALLRRYSVHTECKMSGIEMKIDLLAKKDNGYPITIRPRVNVV